MSKITPQIVDLAKSFVIDHLSKELSANCVFHNVAHTMDVYKNSMIIGNEIGLSFDDLNCLGLAAIFHDVGYVKMYDNHEQESVKIAKVFLESHEINSSAIDQIVRAIIATHVPQMPIDIISMALCDADLMYLTFEDYFELSGLLRLEWDLTGRISLTETEFHKQSVIFFNQHKYHTEYGRKILALKKLKNQERIQKILDV